MGRTEVTGSGDGVRRPRFKRSARQRPPDPHGDACRPLCARACPHPAAEDWTMVEGGADRVDPPPSPWLPRNLASVHSKLYRGIPIRESDPPLPARPAHAVFRAPPLFVREPDRRRVRRQRRGGSEAVAHRASGATAPGRTCGRRLPTLVRQLHSGFPPKVGSPRGGRSHAPAPRPEPIRPSRTAATRSSVSSRWCSSGPPGCCEPSDAVDAATPAGPGRT